MASSSYATPCNQLRPQGSADLSAPVAESSSTGATPSSPRTESIVPNPLTVPNDPSSSHQPTSNRKPRKPRIPLTGTPEEILAKNRTAAPQFWVDKTVRLAGKHWNDFYRNHQAVPFFKERHWTEREWDLKHKLGQGDPQGKGKGKAVLETGCGTGAFIYPLLELYPEAKFVGFDFAAKAVELTKAHANHDPSRVHIFQHDLTEPPTAPSLAARLADVPPEFGEPVFKFDIVSHVFVLSALAPRNHAAAVKTLVGLLKPGGSLLIRDYALHDEAQLRFHALPSASYATVPALLSNQTDTNPTSDSPSATADSSSELEQNRPWYKRGDQTMTYFFSSQEVQGLVDQACRELGVTVEGSIEVVERKLENRAQEWECTRRFVHGSWTRVE
ncbi:class I SAM-dependent methyltransferase [Sporobolomyces koalae]|uniref:class I SAM-dependent methyltransferase n=1 Tax=Sporobolomyces koalae TaxID=500713 RepID=UPI00317F6996